MDEKKNTFAYKVGRMIGVILALCVAACIAGVAIAATIKFYTLIF